MQSWGHSSIYLLGKGSELGPVAPSSGTWSSGPKALSSQQATALATFLLGLVVDRSMPQVLDFVALGRSFLLFLASVLSSVKWVIGPKSLKVVMAGKAIVQRADSEPACLAEGPWASD